MSAPGCSLELMVKHGAIAYRKKDRALLVQQFPRTATGAGGTVTYAGNAPADFMGSFVVDGCLVPAVVECKESSRERVTLTGERAQLDLDQRNALNAMYDFGHDVRLVVAFTAIDEIYTVDWRDVALFVEAPWRKSLPISLFRAFGLLVPVTRDGGTTRCLFLDGAPHPERDRFTLEYWDERKDKPIVSLDGEDDLSDLDNHMPAWGSAYAGMTKEQIRARLEDAMQAGIVNAAKREARKRKWAPRRA